MHFGVVRPTYPASAIVGDFIEVGQAAERLVFVSVWTTDHDILPWWKSYPDDAIFDP